MNALDRVAEEYVLLAHRLDKHRKGLVDAHYGKASELKAIVDSEPLIELDALRGDAERILQALNGDDSERARYLRKQTTALKIIIEKKRGMPISYREEARLCYGISTIDAINEIELLDIVREIDERLDSGEFGDGELSERFVNWRARFELKGDELLAFVLAAMNFAKAKTESLFPLPDNAVEVSLVANKPWTGYHWYRGNYRSLYELNVDVPATIWGALHITTHETFCGHHAEAVVKESELARKRGFVEFSIAALGTPHSLVSEGLAECASFIVIGDAPAVVEWLREHRHLHHRDLSENDARLIELIEKLGRKPIVNAALLMHDENARDDDVFAYLRQYLPNEPSLLRRAIARLRDDDFRAYMLTYPIGKELIMNELTRSQNPAQTFYQILKSVDYQFNAIEN